MDFAINIPASDLIRWSISAGIFAGFVALAFFSRLILFGVMRLVAHRTKTTLDDLIVKALTVPVFVTIIVAGAWIALARLAELAPYMEPIHQGLIILYIAIAAAAVARVLHALLHWYGAEMAHRTKSDIDDRLIPIFRRIVDIPVYAVALMIMLSQLHVDISPIMAGLGIGGLAVALALQSTLSNFFAGTYVITDSIIGKGHYIMLENGPEGFVEDIGWRTTKIRHWQGNLIVIPNSKLADAVVTDFEKPETSMLFIVECGVSYSSDLAKVERVTVEVARKLLQEHPAGVKDFEPVVRFNKFADSNIGFAVVMKGNERTAQFILKHEFVKALHKRYAEEGIEIQYPARKLYFGDRPSDLFGDVIQREARGGNPPAGGK